jgi:CRP/FNR family cyclic AMP-dependent transcriptional regulator
MAPRPATNLFTGLPGPLLRELFGTARPVRLDSDQMLFLAGDPGDGCYLIEQGLLKVTVSSATGGERILAILGPGAVVGELAMIDGAPRATSVSALRECELRFISRGDFEAFTSQHPEVMRHIMAVLAKRIRDTNMVIAAASFLSLKGRVARALLNLAEAFGQDVGQGRILIRQKVSQSDMAAMSGIARENVSRILNDWKRDKLVTRISSYYCLEKRDALEREAEL